VVDAGADALVSILPFREPTYKKFGASHVIIPGVSIISEAQQGLDWGANCIKFSNTKMYGGPSFFKAIEAATHRAIPYVVTGGIRPETIPDYIAGNVLCFIAGFDIIIKDDYEAMQEDFKKSTLLTALDEYTEAVDEARAEYQPEIPFGSGDIDAVIEASGRCLNI
jgi:2-keto-3-deoxy-6-phosphogluconate aldolase